MSALKENFWLEVKQREQSMKHELAGRGQILTIWDNGESRTEAKEAERLKREEQRSTAGKTYCNRLQ